MRGLEAQGLSAKPSDKTLAASWSVGGPIRVTKTVVPVLNQGWSCSSPKGPRTQIVHTLAPKYLYRDYFKAKVSILWVHGYMDP